MPSTMFPINSKPTPDLETVLTYLHRLEAKVDFVSHQLVSVIQTFDVDKCLCPNCVSHMHSITSELAALESEPQNGHPKPSQRPTNNGQKLKQEEPFLAPNAAFALNAIAAAAALPQTVAFQHFVQQLSTTSPPKRKKRKTSVPVKLEVDQSDPPIENGQEDSSPAESSASSPPAAETPPPSASQQELKGCPICGKLLHRGYLPNHVKAKHQNRQPALCNFCHKEFSFVSNLYRHLRKIHNATHQDNNALNPASAGSTNEETQSIIDEMLREEDEEESEEEDFHTLPSTVHHFSGEDF